MSTDSSQGEPNSEHETSPSDSAYESDSQSKPETEPERASVAEEEEEEEEANNPSINLVSRLVKALSERAFVAEEEEEDEVTNYPPIDPSSRLVKALSESGELYGTLWPIIIEMASPEQQKMCLCYVNTFFAGIVRRIEADMLSDIAKWEYYQSETSEIRAPMPVHLDLEVLRNAHWASWGAKRLDFGTVSNFRAFCDLGDVDLDTGAYQYNMSAWRMLAEDEAKSIPEQLSWIFISRNRDIIFETSLHSPNEDAYAHYFGISGRADRVKHMYDYVVESKGVSWDELEWGSRGYI